MIAFLNELIRHLNYFFELWFLLSVLSVDFFKGSSIRENTVWKKFRFLFIMAVSAVLAPGIYLLDQNITIPFPGVFWLYLAIGLAGSLLLARDDILKCAIEIVVYVIALMLIRYLISGMLLEQFSEYFTEHGNSDLVVGIICLLIIFGFSRVMKKLAESTDAPFPTVYGSVLLGLLAAVFAMLVERNSEIRTISAEAYPLLLLGMVTMSVYVLFVHINEDAAKRLRQSLMLRELELNERHIKETEQLYEDLRHLRHELKNHDFYIHTLVENREYEKLEEYFMECYRLEDKKLIDTGNITVNAILNAKVNEAREKNIPVEVEAALPEKLSLEAGDLFSLLANILDNAMEHADPADPGIRIKMEMVKAYLSIVVSNRVDKSVLEANPSLRTSKKDPARHGIGVKVIRRITEKYDGIVDFSEQDHRFTVSVLLKV